LGASGQVCPRSLVEVVAFGCLFLASEQLGARRPSLTGFKKEPRERQPDIEGWQPVRLRDGCGPPIERNSLCVIISKISLSL
jgi:hypothetical protein